MVTYRDTEEERFVSHRPKLVLSPAPPSPFRPTQKEGLGTRLEGGTRGLLKITRGHYLGEGSVRGTKMGLLEMVGRSSCTKPVWPLLPLPGC